MNIYSKCCQILKNSAKFGKFWEILKAVSMQACDLECLEYLEYLDYHVRFCKILHNNAELYKILK